MTTATTRHPRGGVVGTATAAAVAFAALTVVQISAPRQTQPFTRTTDYVIEALFLAGLIATVAVTAALQRWHRGRDGWSRLGAVGAAVFGTGTTGLAVAAALTLLAGRNEVVALFGVGMLTAFTGSLILAVAAFRAALLPRPIAVLIGVHLPLAAVVGEPAGVVVMALLWGAVSVAARLR